MSSLSITKDYSRAYESPEVIALSVSIETGYACSDFETNGANEPFTPIEGVWE